jgi:ABC-type transport system involved in cytochrome bd biosynthesis fused ATPase/permease subunit
LKEPEVSAKDDIVMKAVNFTYISRPDQRVLKSVSVTFPAGKTTAIVGPSGSGKSTIVALIQRWYELEVGGDENPIVSMPCYRSMSNCQCAKTSSNRLICSVTGSLLAEVGAFPKWT